MSRQVCHGRSVALFFAAWILLVPWVASGVWLTVERLKSMPAYTLVQAASDAALVAVFGVVFSLIVTVPLSMLVLIWSVVLPKAFERRSVLFLFPLLLGAIGGKWALYTVRDAGFQGNFWVTLITGGLAGVVLGGLSFLLLRLKSEDPDKLKPK